ncbi:hypothetical protein QOT17_000563 [Balamuthia mandrillaris]
MQDQRAIPILKEGLEPLRDGLASNAAGGRVLPQHPLEESFKNFVNNDTSFKRAALSNVFGSHMSLRLQAEEAILSEFQRLPSLHSERSGLKTMLGVDDDLGFVDFLQDPSYSETSVDLHNAMEAKLGL